MAFVGVSGTWAGPDLPDDPDSPVFNALLGALFDRLLLLEPLSVLGSHAPAGERMMAKTFTSQWWEMLAGGDLDGRAWLERITLGVEPAGLRDPSRTVLETAQYLLGGRSSKESWRQGVFELQELLEHPAVDRWSAARFPEPDDEVGRWDGPNLQPSPRSAEYLTLRTALPVCVELDAALDRDVELASVAVEINEWSELRAHASATGERICERAVLGATAEFPGPEADIAAVMAVARSLQTDELAGEEE